MLQINHWLLFMVVVFVVVFCLFCFVIVLQYNKISVDNHAEVLFWLRMFYASQTIKTKNVSIYLT